MENVDGTGEHCFLNQENGSCFHQGRILGCCLSLVCLSIVVFVRSAFRTCSMKCMFSCLHVIMSQTVCTLTQGERRRHINLQIYDKSKLALYKSVCNWGHIVEHLSFSLFASVYFLTLTVPVTSDLYKIVFPFGMYIPRSSIFNRHGS